MRCFIYLFFLLWSFSSSAQITFHRAYTANSDATGYDGIATMDGGYLLVGRTIHASQQDAIYIVKTDTMGIPVWRKEIYTVGSNITTVFSAVVRELPNGEILIASTQENWSGSSSNPFNNIIYCKLDASGNLIWNKKLDPGVHVAFYMSSVNSMEITPDGGGIMDGSHIVKFDNLGNIAWVRQGCDKILPIPGGYISVAGSTGGAIIVQKRDTAGNIILTKSVNNNGDKICQNICRLSDGGYMVVANYRVPQSSSTEGAYLCRMDSVFNVRWSKRVDGPGVDILNSVVEAPDGGYVFAGNTSSFTGTLDGYLLKLDTAGNLVWGRSFGSNYEQYFDHVSVSGSNAYAVTGSTGVLGAVLRHMYLVKTDLQGNTSCLQTNTVPQVLDTMTTVSTTANASNSVVAANLFPANQFSVVSANGTSIVFCASCTSTIQATVTVTGPTTFCLGGSAQLTASSGVNWLWSNGATGQSIYATDSGSYTVTISDSAGCTNTSTPPINIIVLQPVVPTITPVGDTLRSSPAVTYQWYDASGVIAGATSRDYLPSQNGYYTVKTTDVNGCEAYSQGYNFVTGIDDIAFVYGIYPNPAHNQIFIKAEKYCTVVITDLTGRIIHSTSVEKNMRIDVSQWPNGLFIAVFTDIEGRRYAHRFMIE